MNKYSKFKNEFYFKDIFQPLLLGSIRYQSYVVSYLENISLWKG